MAVLIGAIADDFTGATDLALTLVNQGMCVTQVIGIPDEHTDIGDAEAVIVALKSRTTPAKEAVDLSLAALDWLRSKGAWPNRKIDVDAIAAGQDVGGSLIEWAVGQPAQMPVLIYASADPDEVPKIQNRHGVDEAGAMIERVMGQISVGLVDKGFNRIVIAGGETSGAVISALGIKTLRIGPEIDPGVPWTESFDQQHLALALKSGNFGGENFLAKAFEVLG